MTIALVLLRMSRSTQSAGRDRNMSTSTITARKIAWISAIVLLVLHHDFWRVQRPVLYWGWLPEELLYRMTWLGLAWVFLLFFCRFIWQKDGA